MLLMTVKLTYDVKRSVSNKHVDLIKMFTISTPPGEMKIPLPIIEPTITVTPFSKLIFGFNSIVESSVLSLTSLISFRGTF